MKYQSSSTHCSKVISKVKVFKKWVKLLGQGHRVKNNGTHGKDFSQGILMWNIKLYATLHFWVLWGICSFHCLFLLHFLPLWSFTRSWKLMELCFQVEADFAYIHVSYHFINYRLLWISATCTAPKQVKCNWKQNII